MLNAIGKMLRASRMQSTRLKLKDHYLPGKAERSISRLTSQIVPLDQCPLNPRLSPFSNRSGFQSRRLDKESALLR
jgi:hypothetical protein